MNYLEQKYSESGITEDDIEKEYQSSIESGEIDYYSENIEKQETPEEIETEYSEEQIQVLIPYPSLLPASSSFQGLDYASHFLFG